jgi:hypothetical protein
VVHLEWRATPYDTYVYDTGDGYCGNGVCGGYEDGWSCPDDCGYPYDTYDTGDGYCGNGTCGPYEDEWSCPDDCGYTYDTGYGYCGNGICGGYEDCSSCAEDCGSCCGDGTCDWDEDAWACPEDCSTCGDGLCDVDEDTTSCPEDCGYPYDTYDTGDGYCGNGTCGGYEDEWSCPEDCGYPYDTDTDVYDSGHDSGSDTGCVDLPDFEVSGSVGVEADLSSPSLAGTRGSIVVSATASAGGGAADGECFASAGFDASVEVCGYVLGNGACVGGSASASRECTTEMVCDAPPMWTCDPDTECCTDELSGGLDVSRTFGVERRLGPFACEFSVTAGIGGEASGSGTDGPGCDCDGGSSVTGSITVSAGGGGSCSARLFRRELGVGGSVEACATGSGTIEQGCGGGPSLGGGAELTITVEPLTWGWFSIPGYEQNFSTGDGC